MGPAGERLWRLLTIVTTDAAGLQTTTPREGMDRLPRLVRGGVLMRLATAAGCSAQAGWNHRWDLRLCAPVVAFMMHPLWRGAVGGEGGEEWGWGVGMGGAGGEGRPSLSEATLVM